MVYQIIFKKLFRNKLEKIFSYIENEFGLLIAQKFAEEIDKKLTRLQQTPLIGKSSVFIINTRSIIAGKHNRIHYRIEPGKIIILNMYDMRINPKKNKLK